MNLWLDDMRLMKQAGVNLVSGTYVDLISGERYERELSLAPNGVVVLQQQA